MIVLLVYGFFLESVVNPWVAVLFGGPFCPRSAWKHWELALASRAQSAANSTCWKVQGGGGSMQWLVGQLTHSSGRKWADTMVQFPFRQTDTSLSNSLDTATLANNREETIWEASRLLSQSQPKPATILKSYSHPNMANYGLTWGKSTKPQADVSLGAPAGRS